MRRRSIVVAVALGVSLIGVIVIPVLYTHFVYLSSGRRMQDLRVAYYNGEGAWSTDDIIIPNLVAWIGCEFTTLRGSDIQAGALTDVDVLIWPGGHYPAYWEEVGLEGKTKIQEFVANGGGYFGICAGAYYACDYMVWMDDPAFPPPNYKVEGDELNLDLFPGVAWGPIFEIADRPEPGYAMTQINIINQTHPISDSLPAAYQILYVGGPYIQPYNDTDYTVLGTYDLTGEPAIVSCNYGSGRVFLIGPHAEIEEHSDRDGWQFPPEYLPEPTDTETEWPLLFEAMRWLGNVTPFEPIPPLTISNIPGVPSEAIARGLVPFSGLIFVARQRKQPTISS
jgi:glutamine amidotransferase-like uncharacterized protein